VCNKLARAVAVQERFLINLAEHARELVAGKKQTRVKINIPAGVIPERVCVLVEMVRLDTLEDRMETSILL
jgi:hypothetical protein